MTVGIALARAGRSSRIDPMLGGLQDTTAEIGVRIAVALLVGFNAFTAAALVSAGLLSVLVFPPLALAQARRLRPAALAVPTPVLELRAHRPMGTQD